MAWTFRASGAQSSDNNAASLASIGLPTGWQAGDLHILHFQNYGGTSSRTPPATLTGWSDPTTWQNGTTSHAVYWRVAQSGDTAPTLSLSGTGATGDTQLARIHGFYPRSGATITRNQLGTNSTNASADNVGPITGITPTAADLVILTCGKSNDWNGTATLTNWTLATQSESTTGNDAGMALLYQLSSNGAATGNLTVTDNGGTASNGVGLGKLISFTETLVKTASVSGGMTAAGAATTSFAGTSTTYSFAASGGMTAAGAATTSSLTVKRFTATGGMTAAGAGTTSYVEQPPTEYVYVAGTPGEKTILSPMALPFAYNREFETRITLSGAATASWLSVYSFTASGGMTTGGAGTTAPLYIKYFTASGGMTASGAATTLEATVYTYSSWYFDWYFGEYFDLPDGITTSGNGTWSLTKAYTATGAVAAGGSAVTSYQDGAANTYSYTASGGVTAGGAGVTSYVEGTGEYVPPVYGGIFSRPTRKDQESVKRWLEKLSAKVWSYLGTGGLKLSGYGYARFVRVIEDPKVTPFKVGEGVKRPILNLKTPRKKPKAQPDKTVIAARKAEAMRLAKRKVEEEVLLMALI